METESICNIVDTESICDIVDTESICDILPINLIFISHNNHTQSGVRENFTGKK